MKKISAILLIISLSTTLSLPIGHGLYGDVMGLALSSSEEKLQSLSSVEDDLSPLRRNSEDELSRGMRDVEERYKSNFLW